MLDDMANSADEKVAKLGLSLMPLIWPHTETRAYRWGELKKFLLTTDMQIEQIFDICIAHLDLLEGRRGLAQILVDPAKIECAPSRSTREMGMMSNLAKGLKDAKTGAKACQKLPMEMGLKDIGQFNKRFARRVKIQAVTVDEKHLSREPQITIADVLLPSWDMLVEGGYVNLN